MEGLGYKVRQWGKIVQDSVLQNCRLELNKIVAVQVAAVVVNLVCERESYIAQPAQQPEEMAY